MGVWNSGPRRTAALGKQGRHPFTKHRVGRACAVRVLCDASEVPHEEGN